MNDIFDTFREADKLMGRLAKLRREGYDWWREAGKELTQHEKRAILNGILTALAELERKRAWDGAGKQIVADLERMFAKTRDKLGKETSG